MNVRAHWATDVLLLDEVELIEGVWRARRLPNDEMAIADEAYHDAEAAKYDGYLLEEPYLSTESWLVPWLIRHLRHGVVVDLGCGTGRLVGPLTAAGCRVIAVDRSVAMLERVNRDGSDTVILRADARSLPIKAGSCSTVVCSGVLHHIEQWPSVVREAGRILEPGGRLIIREPNANYAAGLFRPLETLLAAISRDSSDDSDDDAMEPAQWQIKIDSLRRHLSPIFDIEVVAEPSFFASLGVPTRFPFRRSYYSLANGLDRLLVRLNFRLGGALLLMVATRSSGGA